MKSNKKLIIELNYCCFDELGWINFYKEGCKHPFKSIDGGYCTHEQFNFAKGLITEGKFDTIHAAVACELDRLFKGYEVKYVYH